MNPTSLQNIVSRDKSPLRPNEVTQLFGCPEYPRFELK